MSPTTLPRSRPATLHDITMRRCTFSRSTMLGPSSRRTSASSRMRHAARRRGCRSAGRRSRSKSARCSPRSNLTTRSNDVPRSNTRRRPCRRGWSRSPRPRRRAAARTGRIAARFRTNRTSGTSICCSSDRSDHAGRLRMASLRAACPGAAASARSSPNTLHGDVGARARQHVVDAVRDRLADRHVGAGQRARTAGAARPAVPRVDGPSRARPTSISAASTPWTCSS